MQVHSAFQLTSVAAVAAVAATRQPRKPAAAAPRRQSASPRDLLVLHQDVQLPPGFPTALGSAGGSQHCPLLITGRSPCQVASANNQLLRLPLSTEHDVLYCSRVAGDVPHSMSNDMMSVDTPAASSRSRSRRGSPQHSSQPVVTGLQV